MTPWRWAETDKELLEHTFLMVGGRLLWRCLGFNQTGELLDVHLCYPIPGSEPGLVFQCDGKGSSEYITHRLKVPVTEEVRHAGPERDRWVASMGRAYWCGTGWLDVHSNPIPDMPATFVISVR